MSMNKKTRSLINTRYEAQKIYYQRKEIKRKDKEIEELNNVKEFYKRKALDYKNSLKRISEKIIIDKLERDINKFEAEISDIIDKVEYSELYQMRYERLLGAKNYCKDLLEFFSKVRDNI